MQFRNFRTRIRQNPDGDFGRRRLSDALRKDVDGIIPSDCGARARRGRLSGGGEVASRWLIKADADQGAQ
jgi:hypothetical protein